MGEVVYLRKNQEGVTKYISEIISANNLIKGRDFEVVSFLVLDSDFTSHSLGGFLRSTSNKLFKDVVVGHSTFALSLVADKNVEGVMETPMSKNDNLVFYRLAEEVNIDLATEIGLGVVRYKGEYLVYSPSNTENNPIDIINEMLSIKVYMQLFHPEDVDYNLKKSFEDYENLIQSNMIVNAAKHMNTLKTTFRNV